jgi:hypothetical protein
VPTTNNANRRGRGRAGVTALAPGCDGELYVATGSPWDSTGTGLDLLKPGAAPHDLAADAWTAFSYPQLPSNNLADVAVDCQAGNLWVAGPHHLSPPDMFGMNGGRWQGGGVGHRLLSGGTWTRHDTTNGMQSFGDRDAKGEVVALLPGPEGSVWAGAYGTKDLSTAALINQRPYFTAQLNTYKAGAWTNQPFPSAGWISAIARDPDGRLWLGTSRNGLAREAIDPEGWRTDRKGGGLLVHDGTAWHTLGAADTGLPSNDISAVAVSAEGDVWVATDGWGLARFMKGAAEPTATPTLGLASPTPTPTVSETPATATPTVPEATPTPNGSPSPSATGPSPTFTRRPTTPGGPRKVYLPFLHQRRPR